MVKIMHAKEAYCKAVTKYFSIYDEFAAILKKIDESAAFGSFDCRWYITNNKYMLVDEDRHVTSNDIVEKYTVDELYKIIVHLLCELGYYVSKDGNKLIISWGNQDFIERFVKNA